MFFWRKRSIVPVTSLPAGERVYAIGDIHGEAALFHQLLEQIHEDGLRRGPARTTLVLLGDVIDRGERSADLLHMLMGVESPRFVILKGNHEEALVDCYDGTEEALGFWLQFGGRTTLAGFGIDDRDIEAMDTADLLRLMQSRFDKSTIDWLDKLPLSWSLGDYFFTHAGVRPGVPLGEQDPDDLMWIREPFLTSERYHGKVIVHGHTIEPGVPRLGGNRIGLDTGAHEYGCLTALGLEGDQQWLLQATDAELGKGLGRRRPIVEERLLEHA